MKARGARNGATGHRTLPPGAGHGFIQFDFLGNLCVKSFHTVKFLQRIFLAMGGDGKKGAKTTVRGGMTSASAQQLRGRMQDDVLTVFVVLLVWWLFAPMPSSWTSPVAIVKFLFVFFLPSSFGVIAIAALIFRLILFYLLTSHIANFFECFNALFSRKSASKAFSVRDSRFWKDLSRSIVRWFSSTWDSISGKPKPLREQRAAEPVQEQRKPRDNNKKVAFNNEAFRNNKRYFEQNKPVYEDTFLMGGHVESSVASSRKDLLHRETISDGASLNRFLQEVEEDKKRAANTKKPVSSQLDPERFLYLRPVEASSGRKPLPLSTRSFNRYVPGKTSQGLDGKGLSYWQSYERLVDNLQITEYVDEFAQRTRENLSVQVFGAWLTTMAKLNNFFLQAKQMELAKPDISQWKKDELLEARDSVSKIAKYFQKYYGTLTDVGLQQHLKMASTLDKMATSINGAQVSGYCKKRIIELAQSSYLGNFQYNGGGSWKGLNWNRRLPTDALLTLRLFCSHVAELSGVDILEHHYIYHGDAEALFPEELESLGTPNAGQYDAFIDEDVGFEFPIKYIAFVEFSFHPNPHFAILVEDRTLALSEAGNLLSDAEGIPAERDFEAARLFGSRRVKINGGTWQLWHPQPGSENVFHTIALFIYFIETRMDNQLISFNPSRFGLQLS
jgi:hypothetical protein